MAKRKEEKVKNIYLYKQLESVGVSTCWRVDLSVCRRVDLSVCMRL